MSMLAGPRRKQKVINLRAKNNEWSKDNNKFGQRMLEKMGWTSGKGLGAKENGIVEHVVARYKNDEKGLGFEDKNDQWTKHEDDFNSLLANLSNANEDTSIKLHSGFSLEDKSKKSKARIHYHKFTRGKDLSRYSEKDLANIFGKRSFKEEQTELYQSKDDDVIIPTEQVFTEKGSMEDYFRNKLTTLKKKNKNVELNYKNLDSDYNASCGFQGFLGTTDNICDSSILIEAVNDNNVENAPKIKKKKKKKSREGTPEDLDSKNVKETFSSKGCVTEKHKLEPEHEDFEIKKQKVSKKCKQEKKKTVQSTDIEYIVEKVKKKKKRKNKDM